MSDVHSDENKVLCLADSLRSALSRGDFETCKAVLRLAQDPGAKVELAYIMGEFYRHDLYKSRTIVFSLLDVLLPMGSVTFRMGSVEIRNCDINVWNAFESGLKGRGFPDVSKLVKPGGLFRGKRCKLLVKFPLGDV